MKIGDIKYGREIGNFTGTRASGKFIWDICPDCGKKRWIRIYRRGSLCRHCAHLKTYRENKGRMGFQKAENHPFWKGGVKTINGYIYIHISKSSKFHKMFTTGGNYCAEHRLIMARHLRRSLRSNEVVHHINGIKSDNRIENLKLIRKEKHLNSYAEAFKEGYDRGYLDALEKTHIL